MCDILSLLRRDYLLIKFVSIWIEFVFVKGHCVAVFDEDGAFLRRIGSESVTNFPNGIDISDAGKNNIWFYSCL